MRKHLFLDTKVNTPDGPGIISKIEKNVAGDILYIVSLDRPFLIVDPYSGEKEYPSYLKPRSIGYPYLESLVTPV